MPPTRRKKRQLTCDEGIQILVFWQLGMTYEAIAKLFHDVSPFQVEYLVQKGHPMPRYVQLSLSQEFYLTISSKHFGRPFFITNNQLQELILFVYASFYN